MSKSEFIEKIARKGNLSKTRAEEVYRIFVANIHEGLEEDGLVRISGLGTFELKPVPSRKGRNPRTGETIDIPESTRVTFRGSTAIKRRIN